MSDCGTCGGSGKEPVDWQVARELGWSVADVEAERGSCPDCNGTGCRPKRGEN